MRSFKKKLLKDRKSGRRLRVGKLAPSFSGILYDRTFFDTVESFKDNANILVKKQGLPFMFNHFFFLKIFFVKVPYVQQRSFYREFLWIIAVVFSVESLVQSNLLSIEPLIQSNFVWTLEINTDRILNKLSPSPLHELFWY